MVSELVKGGKGKPLRVRGGGHRTKFPTVMRTKKHFFHVFLSG
jgi:hypothetical protein